MLPCITPVEITEPAFHDPVVIVPTVVIDVEPAYGAAPISYMLQDTLPLPSTLLPVLPIVKVRYVCHLDYVL